MDHLNNPTAQESENGDVRFDQKLDEQTVPVLLMRSALATKYACDEKPGSGLTAYFANQADVDYAIKVQFRDAGGEYSREHPLVITRL